MLRADFIARFPRATEAVIKLNCSDAVTRTGPIPLPRPPRAAKAKESASGAKPKTSRQRVPRTRNAGTWTESTYWTRLRSCLRRMSMFWKPAQDALRAARVAAPGPRGRKWLFLCADCAHLFTRKHVQIDHITPVGKLTDHAHLPDFVARLLPEDTKAFRIVCKSCHQKKTNAERASK